MPANIAHMLIAHKALQKLKDKGVKEFTRFAEMLDDSSRGKNYKAYMNLGSIGPDLYYYADIGKNIKDLITEKFVQTKGVTKWAYHLHSSRPNEYPLKLIEIIFSDAVRKNGKVKLEGDDIRRLAYVAGHLTHIAGDQIIHPVVNDVAGPYYRSGANRKNIGSARCFRIIFFMKRFIGLRERAERSMTFLSRSSINGRTACRG